MTLDPGPERGQSVSETIIPLYGKQPPAWEINVLSFLSCPLGTTLDLDLDPISINLGIIDIQRHVHHVGAG